MPYVLNENDNLVTYYLMPLVGVNKAVFGRKFVNSYLDKKGMKIYIHLKSEMESTGHTLKEDYVTEVELNDKLFLIYHIKPKYSADVRMFILGKYSKFKRETKKLIYASSSLPYNKSVGDFKMTSPILQALDSTIVLRNYLLDTLNIKTLPNSAELIDIPDKSWFIESQI